MQQCSSWADALYTGWGNAHNIVSNVEAPQSAAPRDLIKTIDVTGREVRNPAHQMVFRLYSDGTTEKAIVGDRD